LQLPSRPEIRAEAKRPEPATPALERMASLAR
jgi:hypothetical protein